MIPVQQLLVMDRNFQLPSSNNKDASKEACNHEWAEVLCISEDFTALIPDGKECVYCGERMENAS